LNQSFCGEACRDSNFPEKNNSQILIYQTEGGKTKIEVRLENETVWLTQKADGRAVSDNKTQAFTFKTFIMKGNYHLRQLSRNT